MKSLSFLFLFFSALVTHGQIDAKFTTNVGEFTVRLDHANSPLATANFMLLAGLEDDEWLSPPGINFPAPNVLYSPARPGINYLKTSRASLNVVYQEAQSESDVPKYIIRLGQIIVGQVHAIPFGTVYQDLLGNGQIEIQKILNENRFKIVIKHPRRWLDSRFPLIRDAPMYRNLPISRIENRRRFFSGSFTDSPFDGPGYQFPDELVREDNPFIPPWGNHFNAGWVLAMDNAVRNGNGSRFFITGQPIQGDTDILEEWNRRYTVFGTVLTTNNGRAVVNNILSSGMPDGTPNGNFDIQSIEITRGGVTDSDFFVHLVQNDLPGLITPQQLKIETSGDNLALITPPNPRAQTLAISTSDLINDPSLLLATVNNPFDFAEGRIEFPIPNQPQRFFQGYSIPFPHWPSDDFNFSQAQIRFSNVFSNDAASGFITLTFNQTIENSQDPNNDIPEASSGTYLMNLPQIQVEVGDGSVMTFPPAAGTGIFTSEFDPTLGPYKGKLTILTSTPAIGSDLPVKTFNLDFDYRQATPLQERVSRFNAIGEFTGNPTEVLYFIQGVWQKTN